MNPAFAADTAAIFGDALSIPAEYRPAGGDPIAIRCILTMPDDVIQAGLSHIGSGTAIILVRFADLAQPSDGDEIATEQGTFVVNGLPRRPGQRLFWRIEGVPEDRA